MFNGQTRVVDATGADGVTRKVLLKWQDSLAQAYWRVTRKDARRIAAQPIRIGYDQRVAIGGQWCWIVRTREHTANWGRVETRFMIQPDTTMPHVLTAAYRAGDELAVNGGAA